MEFTDLAQFLHYIIKNSSDKNCDINKPYLYRVLWNVDILHYCKTQKGLTDVPYTHTSDGITVESDYFLSCIEKLTSKGKISTYNARTGKVSDFLKEMRGETLIYKEEEEIRYTLSDEEISLIDKAIKAVINNDSTEIGEATYNRICRIMGSSWKEVPLCACLVTKIPELTDHEKMEAQNKENLSNAAIYTQQNKHVPGFNEVYNALAWRLSIDPYSGTYVSHDGHWLGIKNDEQFSNFPQVCIIYTVDSGQANIKGGFFTQKTV